MKKLFLVFFIAFFCSVGMAQIPNWDWAKGVEGPSEEAVTAVAADRFGNVYVGGWFISPTLTLGSTILTRSGLVDMFVAKYDAAGNALWAKNAVSTNNDHVLGLAVDIAGSVYVVGDHNSEFMQFGNHTVYNSDSTGSVPSFDLYIVKYDSTGNVVWARNASGTEENDLATCVFVDQAGFVYVGGNFQSNQITFDGITLDNYGQTNDHDAFVVKLDNAGNAIWAKSAGGEYRDYVQDISADPSGNVFIGGYFRGEIMKFGLDSLVNEGNYHTNEGYVAKYDAQGVFEWAKKIGGLGDDEVAGVSANHLGGDVYVAGEFKQDTMYFDSLHFLTNTSLSTAYWDLYLVRYDALGNVVWVSPVGQGNRSEEVRQIDSDPSGNVYLAGLHASDSLIFGSTVVQGTAVFSSDVFFASYDDAGNALWAAGVCDTSAEYGNAISVNHFGDVFVGGQYESPELIFGANTIVNVDPGDLDGFVAKLGILVGVQDGATPMGMHIYPNPFQSSTILDLGRQVRQGSLHVYDLNGLEVHAQALGSGQRFGLDRGNLARGMYIVRAMEGGNVIATGKIVVAE